MSTQVRVVAFACLAWMHLYHSSFAQEPPASPGPESEPIEFIDNSRPPQTEVSNPRPTETVPTGWGFATFSPDSKSVATVSVPEGADAKGEVLIWNLDDLKAPLRIELPGKIAIVSFSPDGKWLAIGPNEPRAGVQLVDTKTGKVGMTLPGPVAKTNVITWSPDGTELVPGSTTDKTVRVWNVTKKEFVRTYEPEASKLLAIDLSGSGRLLAAIIPAKDPEGLALYDVFAGTVEKSLKGHKQQIEGAAFTGAGKQLATVGWDAVVRVWDIDSGEETAVIKGHKKGIRSIATSTNGKRLASCNDRSELKLWDGEKHELLSDLGGENGSAKFVSMSPDGAWLVSITRDGTATLWDLEKQSEKATLNRETQTADTVNSSNESTSATNSGSTPSSSDAPEPEAIQSLAYSPDGKWIALAREDGRISLRNAEDGKVVREMDAFPDVASCVTFSPDSKQVAAGSFDKTIKVWDVDTGEQSAEFTGHTNWVFAVAFSPDGKTLASGSYDKVIKLWNLADKKEAATLSGHTAGVRSVVFTHDSALLISGSADRTAIVWTLADLEPVTTLKGHTAAIRAVAISPDGGTLATASEDATVKLWKTSDWTERASLPGTEGVMFWSLAFSPAGRTLAAGAFDGTVKLFDPRDGKERQLLRGPTEAITAVAFGPNADEVIAGSVDKSLRRWKAKSAVAAASSNSSKPIRSSEKSSEGDANESITVVTAATLGVEQVVSSLCYSRDGTQLAVGGAYRTAGKLQLWDVTRRERKWESDEFRFGLPAVAFSSDEKRIAVGNFADNFLRTFDSSTGKQLKEIRGHRAKIHGIANSPDGKFFATASLDRDLKLWDAATYKEARTYVGHSDFVFSVQFSPDGRRLLSGSADRTARLWDVTSGKELIQLKGHQGAVQQAIFSKDGQLIATASSDGTVRIYQSQTGNFLLTLRGHRNKIDTVAYSPDGKLIATGSADKSIRLWDPGSGLELIKLQQEGPIRALVFSPDGKHLASGCDDKTVRLWEITRSEGKKTATETGVQ